MKRLLAMLLCISVVLVSVQPAFAQLRDDDGGDVNTPATVAGTGVYMVLNQLSLSVNDRPDDFQMAENGWLDFFDLAHPLNSLLLSNMAISPPNFVLFSLRHKTNPGVRISHFM